MQNGLWVTGGINPDGGYLKNTEIIYVNGTVTPGPTLDFLAYGHCLVEYEGNIYLIGGKQNGWDSNATWIYNTAYNFELKEGASMKKQRVFPACEILKHSIAHSGRFMMFVPHQKGLIILALGCPISEFWVEAGILVKYSTLL